MSDAALDGVVGPAVSLLGCVSPDVDAVVVLDSEIMIVVGFVRTEVGSDLEVDDAEVLSVVGLVGADDLDVAGLVGVDVGAVEGSVLMLLAGGAVVPGADVTPVVWMGLSWPQRPKAD